MSAYVAPRSADGTCRVWGLRDAAQAREVEDGVEVPVQASVMPHAQYIGAQRAVLCCDVMCCAVM
jgi:hypothetical protein